MHACWLAFSPSGDSTVLCAGHAVILKRDKSVIACNRQGQRFKGKVLPTRGHVEGVGHGLVNDHQHNGCISGSVIWHCSIDVTCAHTKTASILYRNSGMPSAYFRIHTKKDCRHEKENAGANA